MAQRKRNSAVLSGLCLQFALAYASGLHRSYNDAARAVGASGADGARWLKLPEVLAVVATQRAKKRLKEIETEAKDQNWVRSKLRLVALRWEEGSENAASAVRALELLGKDLGMWPDKLTIEASLRSAPDSAVLAKLRDALASGALSALLDRPAAIDVTEIPSLPAPENAPNAPETQAQAVEPVADGIPVCTPTPNGGAA